MCMRIRGTCAARLDQCDCKRRAQSNEHVLPMSSIAPYAHHSHAASGTGRVAADIPDGVTLTQRHATLVLCKSWPRRLTARIGHLREASRQCFALCFRDKLDAACCGVLNHDLPLNCSGVGGFPFWAVAD